MEINEATIRMRRSASVWTKIHPCFAFAQLGTFVVSVSLILALLTGHVTYAVVHLSVLIKIGLMIGAMLTGALWERDVYGAFWFVPEYLVEDIMTLVVFLCHGLYIATVAIHADAFITLSTLGIAYVLYAINVGQYILRHRRGVTAPNAALV